MVAEQVALPQTPEWMARQQSKAPSGNRSINDIYWARAQDEASPGYIIVGPSALLGQDGRPVTAQAEKWIRQGRKPLIDYSYTDRVSPKNGMRETIETNLDRLTTPDRSWRGGVARAHRRPSRSMQKSN
jgi:hypothetical protein